MKGQANVRVFVVWEPVLTTDWGRPGGTLTSMISDPRATHFWDHDRRLSALYGGAGNLERLANDRQIGFRMKDVIWDAAFIYAPGVRWGSPAKRLLAPVMKYHEALIEAL